jgi:hypothetical protein
VFIAVVWVIQEFTSFHVLKYVILFIGEVKTSYNHILFILLSGTQIGWLQI